MADNKVLKIKFIHTNLRRQLMAFWSWHSFTPTWDSRWQCSEAAVHSHQPERTANEFLKLTFIYTYLRRWQLSEADIHLHLPEMAGDNFLRLTFIYTYLRQWEDSSQLCDTDTYSHLPETVWRQSTTMWHSHLFTPTWDCVRTVDDYVTLTPIHTNLRLARQLMTTWSWHSLFLKKHLDQAIISTLCLY